MFCNINILIYFVDYKLAAELNDDDGSILKSNQNNEDYTYAGDEGKKENTD